MCSRDADFSGTTCIDHFTVSELSEYEDWRARTFRRRAAPGCPTCGSPAPHLQPKRDAEGRLSPDGTIVYCADLFQQRVTADNTAEDGAREDRVALRGTPGQLLDRLRDAPALGRRQSLRPREGRGVPGESHGVGW